MAQEGKRSIDYIDLTLSSDEDARQDAGAQGEGRGAAQAGKRRKVDAVVTVDTDDDDDDDDGDGDDGGRGRGGGAAAAAAGPVEIATDTDTDDGGGDGGRGRGVRVWARPCKEGDCAICMCEYDTSDGVRFEPPPDEQRALATCGPNSAITAAALVGLYRIGCMLR